jgi:hypothetical protein
VVNPIRLQRFPQNPKRVMVAQEGEEILMKEIEVESGENLMLRRTLKIENKSSLEVDWKQKSMFWKRSKCKDKVCKVIVDGGSIDNMVSTEMVQNLQLTCI